MFLWSRMNTLFTEEKGGDLCWSSSCTSNHIAGLSVSQSVRAPNVTCTTLKFFQWDDSERYHENREFLKHEDQPSSARERNRSCSSRRSDNTFIRGRRLSLIFLASGVIEIDVQYPNQLSKWVKVWVDITIQRDIEEKESWSTWGEDSHPSQQMTWKLTSADTQTATTTTTDCASKAKLRHWADHQNPLGNLSSSSRDRPEQISQQQQSQAEAAAERQGGRARRGRGGVSPDQPPQRCTGQRRLQKVKPPA